MNLKIIFLFTIGIVMVAFGNTEDTTVADVKAALNKTSADDNELDTNDDFEAEGRQAYGYRWYRYRRPVNLQIRVPYFQMYLRRHQSRPSNLGIQVFPDSHSGGLVNINHRWWGKKK